MGRSPGWGVGPVAAPGRQRRRNVEFGKVRPLAFHTPSGLRPPSPRTRDYGDTLLNPQIAKRGDRRLRDPPSRSRTNHNQPRADPIDRTGASPAAARAPFSRQFLSENRKLGYNARFANPQETSMRASAKPPVRNAAARFVRARHVFARLMDGQSMRDIAAAEGLSVRRVQQIVRAEIARREANPAEGYVLVQVARLERALELLGREIDAGRAAAVPAFVRVIEQLGKLAGDPLRLPDPAFRP